MTSPSSKQAQAAERLLQEMQQQLISLATSLKGRLTEAEEAVLTSLFHSQIDLQQLVGDVSSVNHMYATAAISNCPAPDADEKQSYKSDLPEIFTQLMLYAKLIYNETAGSDSDLAEYAIEINKIVKDFQTTDQPNELSLSQLKTVTLIDETAYDDVFSISEIEDDELSWIDAISELVSIIPENS